VKRREFIRSAAVNALVAATPIEIGGLLGGSDGSSVPSRGRAALAAVEAVELRTEQSGYEVYSAAPADFIPARTVDIAGIQKLLLCGQTLDVQRRLYRALAKNAGFVAVRLTDIAGAPETFNWFSMAKHAARRAGDPGIEAWIVGHMSDAHSCYGYSLRKGLDAAHVAQAVGGSRPNSAAVFGFLVEAGLQARLGRRAETVSAVHRAESIFNALPSSAIAADGIRIPEYFLRWHQSNALSVVGERELAEELRKRALELPFSRQDLVGRALLVLDEASLLFKAGEVEQASGLVKAAWDELPAEFHVGQIPSRTAQILSGLNRAQSASQEVQTLKEYVRSLGPS
jgi:hypothetical protein